jgi:hypothetical protein
MSTIYYCDAPGCVKKAAGRPTPDGWTGPEDWMFHNGPEKVLDACSEEHLDEALTVAYPPDPEAEEAESEEQDITEDDVGTIPVIDDTES